MANNLSKEKQVAVISALAEGNSIRSIERMTEIHRDTIMRLGVRVGEVCHQILDQKMRGLNCSRIEIDELWGFIGKKKFHANRADKAQGLGDAWTFLSIVLFSRSRTLQKFNVDFACNPNGWRLTVEA